MGSSAQSGAGMSLRVAPVGFGEAARQALAAFVIDAKTEDPLAPVTVIVPSNYTGLALRRALASGVHGRMSGAGTGLAALDTLTLVDLADRLAGATLQADGRLPLSDQAITAAVRNALSDDPGVLGPVASHHQTADALKRTYQELRDLSSGQLEALGAASQRAAGVVALYRKIRASLHEGWYDHCDVMAAAAAPTPNSAATLVQLGAVAVYLPRRLGQHEARLLRSVARSRRHDGSGAVTVGSTPVTVFVGVTGNWSADAGARSVCDRLGVELPQSSHRLEPATASQIVSASDPDEEARTVVRAVLSDIDAGVAPARIAVFYGSSEPYGRALEELFSAAGVTTYGSTARTLAESAYGRFALGFAELADIGLAEPRLERRAVFDLLAGARVPRRRRAEHDPSDSFFVPDSAWERLARDAHVVGGDDWETRLGRHGDELAAKAAQQVSGTSGRQADWLDSQARECRAAQAFASELHSTLMRGRSLGTWRGLSDWMRTELHRYLGAVGRDRWTQDWPDWERSAAERVDGVLERLSDLGRIEPHTGLEVMARALTAELAQPHGRSGTEGVGVYVGHIAGAIDVVPVRAYVVGLAESIFPRRSLPDSLLGEDERRIVPGALAVQADATVDEHRGLLAALAVAPSGCTLVVPRGDLRQNAEFVPSRWVLDTARSLELAGTGDSSYFAGGYLVAENLAAAALDPAVPDIVESPSFIAGVQSAVFPATVAEYDSASLFAARRQGSGIRSHPMFDEPAFRAGVECSAARYSSEFTRFDGNLAHVIDADGAFADVVSATRLEDWATCPRKYLFSHLLGVGVIEEPEEILRLSALERGSLMHEAIDRFLRPLIAARENSPAGTPLPEAGPGRPPPGPGRAPSDEDRSELVAIGSHLADVAEQHGLTGHALLWDRDRAALLADLGDLLDRDTQRDPATRGETESSEFRFGFVGTPDAVEHSLGDGLSVRLRGAIDRVERTSGGDLVVIDYKSGSARSYKALLNDTDPTLRGTKLQLPVYALAAAQHFGSSVAADPVTHAAYWFISSEPGQWTWLPLTVDRALMERFDQVLRVIVTGIRGGIFPGYAQRGDDRMPHVVCPYCDPDGAGSAEVLRQWGHKRNDAALAAFADLAEPADEDAS